MPTPLPESATLLADLIALQPGAVVSRQVLKEKTGSVTLFAFGAGEGLSEHTTPHSALLLGVEGIGEITIADQRHEVGAGELLLLPAHVPHAVHARNDFKMLLVMLKASPDRSSS